MIPGVIFYTILSLIQGNIENKKIINTIEKIQ